MGSSREYLGGLEEVILLAIYGLREEAYGASVYEALTSAKRHISIGSLYVTLARLEEKGFISSYLGDATAERGGRAKKLLALTGAGVSVLQEAEASRQTLLSKQKLLGGLA